MMKSLAIGIKKIEQVDNSSFEIVWSDGCAKRYALADLQRECPCAQCVEGEGSLGRAKRKSLKEDVQAHRIFSVGRYAIRIEFTSGCSVGIYSYDFLYERGVKQ